MSSDSSRPVIAIICGDAGGAAAVAPVVAALDAAGHVATRAFTYRQASDVWRRHGLPFAILDERLSLDEATRLLRDLQPHVVLTGTSVNEVMLEQRFLEAARRLGVPSISVLDAWVNYAERFGDGLSRFVCLPTRIAIMDEEARSDMESEGFPSSSLVVTGQPAFDGLQARLTAFTESRRQALRATWGVGTGDLLVLFVSQPLAELCGSNASAPRFLGFQEHTVLPLVLRALDDIAEERGRAITLLVRPHPREDQRWLAGMKSRGVRFLVSNAEDDCDAVLAADLVTGMTSALLHQACYLGCLTISLEPGLRGKDMLPTNRLGMSRVVLQPDDVRPALAEWLFDEGARAAQRDRLRTFAPIPGAADRVAQLVHQMVSQLRMENDSRVGQAGH